MKGLPLCVHVVTWQTTSKNCTSACRTCSTIIFPLSTNQIIVFWRLRCCGRRLCLSSLIDFSHSGVQRPRDHSLGNNFFCHAHILLKMKTMFSLVIVLVSISYFYDKNKNVLSLYPMLF